MRPHGAAAPAYGEIELNGADLAELGIRVTGAAAVEPPPPRAAVSVDGNGAQPKAAATPPLPLPSISPTDLLVDHAFSALDAAAATSTASQPAASLSRRLSARPEDASTPSVERTASPTAPAGPSEPLVPPSNGGVGTEPPPRPASRSVSPRPGDLAAPAITPLNLRPPRPTPPPLSRTTAPTVPSVPITGPPGTTRRPTPPPGSLPAVVLPSGPPPLPSGSAQPAPSGVTMATASTQPALAAPPGAAANTHPSLPSALAGTQPALAAPPSATANTQPALAASAPAALVSTQPALAAAAAPPPLPRGKVDASADKPAVMPVISSVTAPDPGGPPVTVSISANGDVNDRTVRISPTPAVEERARDEDGEELRSDDLVEVALNPPPPPLAEAKPRISVRPAMAQAADAPLPGTPTRVPPPAVGAAAPIIVPKPIVSGRRRSRPWFEELFDEDYLRTFPQLSPAQSERELRFLTESLRLTTGDSVLDVGCGVGRQAVELASRGQRVTGLELSLPLLIRAADYARSRDLTVNFVHGDMREMSFDGEFDGVYCVQTSFGYFDDETNRKVATLMARALKPGGRLVLDIVNRDYLTSALPTRVWWQGDGCMVLEEVAFNYFTSRLQVQRSVVFEDGRQVENEISIRAYSLHEIGKILHHAGLRVIEVSGGLALRGRFFGADSRQLLVLAERRTDA